MLQGVLPLGEKGFAPEIVAGLTLAAIGIPEVMGYSKIAGMPVVTGLYTILVPIALFAVLGSSRHLVVGADSATAAILAAGLAGMAADRLAGVRRPRRDARADHGRLPASSRGCCGSASSPTSSRARCSSAS